MKIALISPKGPLYRHRGGIFRRSLRYAPLTLTTLASLVPSELNPEFILVDEGIDDVDLDLRADVIGVTAGQWHQETPVRWLFTAELRQTTKNEMLLYREDESPG